MKPDVRYSGSTLRANYSEPIELRASASDDGTTMFGHFSVFNSWYEINSVYEGRFLERVVRGAFDETFTRNRERIRVLYDHGMDPSLGNKPLGPIDVLTEDERGAFYEVPLLDTDYNRDFVLPALRGRLMNGESRGSQLGASFRFMVRGDQWNDSPKRSNHNPDALPERTIELADVFEFGPVTFGASPAATSGVRGITDEFMDRLATDPMFVARLTERAGLGVVEHILTEARVADRAPERKTGGVADQPSSNAQPSRTSVASALTQLSALGGQR
jgi:HK97 family phage prohead protease